MKILDMMGKNCPIPVIETKKVLSNLDSVKVLVDNEIATKNLSKLASSLNRTSEVITISENEFKVIIKRDGDIERSNNKDNQVKTQAEDIVTNNSYSIVFDDIIMGGGSEVLGAALMKSFTYALSEQDLHPEKIICFNAGVKIACRDSDSLEDLRALQDLGTEILVCGACLDFYDLKDQIAVGEISNMYSIVEAMRESNRIVKP